MVSEFKSNRLPSVAEREHGHFWWPFQIGSIVAQKLSALERVAGR